MKDWNDMSDFEKEILAVGAIENLIKMLEGQDDVYKQVLLEELFKFILGDNHE
jgi:hypothetical protein